MSEFYWLAVGQLSLVVGQLTLFFKINQLRDKSHEHTYWFRDGKKVDETISMYKYQETK